MDSRFSALLITQDQTPEVLASLATAEQFAKDVEAIDVPLEITKDTIALSAKFARQGHHQDCW
jgi:hypothetical protein